MENYAEQIAGIIRNQAELSGEIQRLSKENEELRAKVGTAPVPEVANEDLQPKIPEQTFKSGKFQYQFIIAEFIVPNIGRRTALEVLHDDDKHKELGGKTIRDWLAANTSGVVRQLVN